MSCLADGRLPDCTRTTIERHSQAVPHGLGRRTRLQGFFRACADRGFDVPEENVAGRRNHIRLFKLMADRPKDRVDVQNVLAVQGVPDSTCLHEWAERLGVRDRLHRALAEAGL